jgi:hypothetical protein
MVATGQCLRSTLWLPAVVAFQLLLATLAGLCCHSLNNPKENWSAHRSPTNLKHPPGTQTWRVCNGLACLNSSDGESEVWPSSFGCMGTLDKYESHLKALRELLMRTSLCRRAGRQLRQHRIQDASDKLVLLSRTLVLAGSISSLLRIAGRVCQTPRKRSAHMC